jgi:hypothetical protein
MRRIILATAATLAFASLATFAPGPAEAAVSAPSGIATAIDGTKLVEDAAYVCRRYRVCGRYSCWWRKRCHWVRPYRYWRHGRWYYY